MIAFTANIALALLHGLEPIAEFEHAVWCVAGVLQLVFPFLLASPPRFKLCIYFANLVGYSVLTLGGYFGDVLRAACMGAFLLGTSLTLGNAIERAQRLSFLHARLAAA